MKGMQKEYKGSAKPPIVAYLSFRRCASVCKGSTIFFITCQVNYSSIFTYSVRSTIVPYVV